jgi:sulfur-oxidizing protein SoxA
LKRSNAIKALAVLVPVLLQAAGESFAAAPADTPEQERAAIIQTLKKRLAGTSPSEWIQADGALTVQAIPLDADNATNLADILAIGKKRWDRKFKDGKSMANCFPNGGRRIAASYPQFDAKTRRVVTFEMAINGCLKLHGEPEIGLADAKAIGPLAAYGKSLADHQKLTIRITGAAAKEKYDAGRQLYLQRLGQQGFACASCHVQHAGEIFGQGDKARTLHPAVGQTVSWPRVEPGGTVRTLQMQFQRCMIRSGIEPYAVGSEELNNIEYFLGFLSASLPLIPLSAAR